MNGELILANNILYGTAQNGGSSGNGTLFSVSLPPQLTITRAVGDVALTWPTNFTGYTLESTTNLVVPVVWNTNSSAASVVNGQNTVTNLATGMQRFYRLVQ